MNDMHKASGVRRIAINTGGGDAPGLNAVIRASTLAAIHRGWEVLGIRRGYTGLLEGEASALRSLGVFSALALVQPSSASVRWLLPFLLVALRRLAAVPSSAVMPRCV